MPGHLQPLHRPLKIPLTWTLDSPQSGCQTFQFPLKEALRVVQPGAVETPLLAVGKMYRAGFGIENLGNGEMFLRNPDNTFRARVYLKNNSLAARCRIRMVSQLDHAQASSEVPSSSAQASSEVPNSSAQASSEVPNSSAQASSEVPSSSVQASPEVHSIPGAQCSVRAVTCTIENLDTSIPDYFVQLGPDVFALKGYSARHVDLGMALPREGCEFRSTLVKDGEKWLVLEWCEPVPTMDDPSGLLTDGQSQEVIVFGSRVYIAPADAGLTVVESFDSGSGPNRLPDAPSDQRESEHDEAMLEPQQHEQVEVSQAEQIQVDGALRDEDDQGDSLIVDGITLSMNSTLAVLRQAAQSLGLGRSGGKSTVLKRIRDHLSKQALIAAHQARQQLVDATVRVPNEQSSVTLPSEEEQRKHCLTHTPFASWCSHCVAFRAKADRHESRHDDARVNSVLAFDFCYTSREEGAEKLCCLAASDSQTKWIQAWPVKSKGGTASRNYMASELTKLLSYLGHRSVTIRADPEPACSALAESVKSLRNRIGMETHVEQTPVGEHQANYSENAVEKIRQHVGTILSELEERLKISIKTFDPLHQWCWRHSSWLLQRFNVMQNLTAWERLHETPYRGKIVKFGECVLARVKSATKGKPRWLRALWLGKSDIADTHLVVTSSGRLVSARSVRRTAIEYDAGLCSVLRDTPDQHASFLAGRVGMSRKQVTPCGVDVVEAPSEEELHYSPSNVPGTDEEDEVIDDVADIAPTPMSVKPTDHVPQTPDAELSHFGSEGSSLVRPPPASAAIATGRVEVPGASVPNPGLGKGVGPGMPMTPPSHLPPLPSGSDLDMGVDPRPEPPVQESDAKRRRVSAITKNHPHVDEVVILDDLGLDADVEQSGEVYDDEDGDVHESGDSVAPSELWRPYCDGEPTMSVDELAQLDQISAAFELDRLVKLEVLEELSWSDDLSNYRYWFLTKWVKNSGRHCLLMWLMPTSQCHKRWCALAFGGQPLANHTGCQCA